MSTSNSSPNLNSIHSTTITKVVLAAIIAILSSSSTTPTSSSTTNLIITTASLATASQAIQKALVRSASIAFIGTQLANTISTTLQTIPAQHYTAQQANKMLIFADAKPLNYNQVKFRRVPPKEFSAALGSSITIECEASASPQPTIHWLKNGKRIQQNDVDENQLDDGQSVSGQIVDDINRIGLSATGARLFIDCASLDDEALYTCVAENEFSRVSTHTKLNIIKPAALNAAVAAAAAEAAAASAADETNDLLDNASPASSGSSSLVATASTSSSGSANAPNKSNDAKMSPLELIAARREQEVAEKALAAIPQCLSGRAQATEPVRIQMWTHNIIEVMKNDVVLYCRTNVARSKSTTSMQQVDIGGAENSVVDKRPIGATITWTLPDDKVVGLEHRDKYEILETGDLLIKDLRWADMGSYVCTVTDEQGSDTVSSFVYPAAAKSTTPWKHWPSKGS